MPQNIPSKQELNKEQQKAVSHIEGPMLVLAGAGSGKTRVVTERICHLLDIGILPGDILAVTFTNKAAKEMQKRVASKTKSHVLTCTFHSLGARILRESISALNYSKDFTIYDEEDSLQLIKTCIKTLQIKEEPGLVKTIKGGISSAKNSLIPPEDWKADALAERKEKLIQKIYPLYQAKLKEYNALDFDDLLYLPVKLFQKDPDLLRIYQEKFLFLLIDEYQDTNKAQYTLAKMLAARHQNIFAVGDPDQSIYSWRGANYENILRFDEDFPQAEIIKLEHNYRSTNTILSASNALIQHNEKRYKKNLFSTLGKGEKIQLHIASSDKKEAAFVAQKLVDISIDKKIPFSDIAVLYRTNAQSRSLEDVLLLSKIPYIIYGGLSFYQRKEIKDLLAFLRMGVSDHDFLSFARTINLPKRGIGKTSIQKFLELTSELHLGIFPLCKSIIKNDVEISLSQRQKESLSKYLFLIEKLRSWQEAKKPLRDTLSDLIEKSDYLTHLKEDPETFEDRKENIEALISKAAEWEEENQTSSLVAFLEDIALITSLEEKEETESIKLMTIHNAKGLEFSLVFIVGLEEDLFPHISAKDTLQDLEEERRLFYVGMTRAKKMLFLTASHYRMLWGISRFMIPSRFIKEVPEKYVHIIPANEEERFIETENFPSFSSFQKNENKSASERKEADFSTGDRVEHQVFGIGIVKKAYSTSIGKTYDVYFEEDDLIRSLVAKYAKLKKL